MLNTLWLLGIGKQKQAPKQSQPSTFSGLNCNFIALLHASFISKRLASRLDVVFVSYPKDSSALSITILESQKSWLAQQPLYLSVAFSLLISSIAPTSNSLIR